MAKAIITLTDEENGVTHIELENVPEVGEGEQLSPAQALAQKMILDAVAVLA